jgi:hypothetical protein
MFKIKKQESKESSDDFDDFLDDSNMSIPLSDINEETGVKMPIV